MLAVYQGEFYAEFNRNATLVARNVNSGKGKKMPKYSNATWGGQTKVLENAFIRVEVHNRSTGWAYVEIYTPEGKLMGVLPYLASVLDSNGGPRGNMATFRRVESPDVREVHTDTEDALEFDVHALTFKEMTIGSFVEFLTPPDSAELTGSVRLSLPKDCGVLKLEYHLMWMGNNGFAALHGPWLLAGADSFGLHKTDGLLPGAEWLRTDEWSSNQSTMMPPLSERTAIHPFKISAPLMAVSHEGDTISLSWDPLCPIIEKRPMQAEYYPQQVFSSPDAINHADQHLMGLMLPNVLMTHKENKPVPDEITAFPRMTRIHFSAEIAVGKGTSVDALADYVKRRGLPEPPKPKMELEEQLHTIAECYNTNLWFERENQTGWGNLTARDLIREDNSEPAISNFHIPEVFMQRYIDTYRGTELADALAEKLAKARAAEKTDPAEKLRVHHGPLKWDMIDRQMLLEYGEGILALQEENGLFLTHLEDQRSATWQPVFINHWPFAEKLYKAMSWDNAVTLETNAACWSSPTSGSRSAHTCSTTRSPASARRTGRLPAGWTRRLSGKSSRFSPIPASTASTGARSTRRSTGIVSRRASPVRRPTGCWTAPGRMSFRWIST